MASYREVNYSVRPAKSVERKMMIEAFRRLHLAWGIGCYRYVGMGSIYFSDLPHGNPDETFVPATLFKQTGVPESDIQRYRDVYRYYPSYAEVAV